MAQPTGFVPAAWVAGSNAPCSVGTQTVAYVTANMGIGVVSNDGTLEANSTVGTGTITFTGAGGLAWMGKSATSRVNTGGEHMRLSATGMTFTVNGSDTGLTATNTPGVVTFTAIGSDWYITDSISSAAVSTAAAVSYTAEINAVSSNSDYAAGGYQVFGADCDEDGEAASPFGTDPDDGDACVRSATGWPYQSVGSAPNGGLSSVPGSGAGGLAINKGGLDCDGDGDSDAAGQDPDDADSCVTKAISTFAGNSTTDCDGDGVLNTGASPDLNDFEVCLDAAGPATGCVTDVDMDTYGQCDGWTDFANNVPASITCGNGVSTDINDNEVCYDNVGIVAGCVNDTDMDGTTGCVGWTSDANAPAGSCDDSDDANPCIDPMVAPTTIDCDMDGTTQATDTDDNDACVNPAYDIAVNIPGGTPDDCDGDGFLASVDDPDDGDECNPKACGDPTPETSAAEQGKVAGEAFGFMHQHMQQRLGTTGQQGPNITLGRDGSTASGGNGPGWFAAGLIATETGGGTNGEGLYTYALLGYDLSETDDSLFGINVGAEAGQWDYDDQPDSVKTGLTGGIYAGRKFGGISLTGALAYTYFINEYTNLTGATGDMTSHRLMASLSVNGLNELANGASFKPYADATFVMEELAAFTYSNGDEIEASTLKIGEVSVGIEYTTAYNPEVGQFFIRTEMEQVLGVQDTELPDGSIFTPYDEPTAEIGFGWISNGGTDNTGRIEYSVSEIGNPDREEQKLSSHWERHY